MIKRLAGQVSNETIVGNEDKDLLTWGRMGEMAYQMVYVVAFFMPMLRVHQLG